ncbi:ERCC4 domain-containing protein [Xylaria nigripes]|nr:ERCC4 domain-containing protein [Xylaria nigripes]
MPTEIISLLSSDSPSPAPSPPPLAVSAEIINIEDSGGSDDSDDLPDLDDLDFSKIRARKRPHSSLSRSTAQASKKNMTTAGEQGQQKKQKVDAKEAKEAREAQKEQKRLEKERAKEERALQKEKQKALAEVNKLRTDKKVSTPEMIVDIPASINSGLKVQIEALLDDMDVQYDTWNSSLDHIVKWRRKVTSRYNKETGLWEPVPMLIEDENHVMVIVQAPEFVKLIFSEEGRDLEAHVLRLTTRFPTSKLIYLIEGLTAWLRKNRNVLNRQFASAVRNLGVTAEPGPSGHRTNNQHQQYVDEDKIEDALLSLQVLHGALIHHTCTPVETAQWVAVFTQHISTIPYRKVRDASADAGFCMDSGQVHAGHDAKDTFVMMLQQITRISPLVAYGISTKYKSVKDLVRGFEEDGPLALVDCSCATKDGTPTDRTIGRVLSKRVHKIFLGQDPASTDV